MDTASDMMHAGVQCVDESMTLAEAAQLMRDQEVGALPICGKDNRLHGIITDRDIVTKCVAAGHEPADITAGQLASDRLVWVESDADASEVSQVMQDNRIRRVPVLDHHRLVGMISEADMAQHLDESALSEYVHAVYTAPPNN